MQSSRYSHFQDFFLSDHHQRDPEDEEHCGEGDIVLAVHIQQQDHCTFALTEAVGSLALK